MLGAFEASCADCSIALFDRSCPSPARRGKEELMAMMIISRPVALPE